MQSPAPAGRPVRSEAARDAAFIDNVARHLRRHPQAEVLDDQGRLRPLSRREAERIAQVTLRAASAWLAPVGAAQDRVVRLPDTFVALDFPEAS